MTLTQINANSINNSINYDIINNIAYQNSNINTNTNINNNNNSSGSDSGNTNNSTTINEDQINTIIKNYLESNNNLSVSSLTISGELIFD